MRLAQQSVEPLHLVVVDLGGERQEDVLREQVVARRVAVRARYRAHRDSDHNDEAEQHGCLAKRVNRQKDDNDARCHSGGERHEGGQEHQRNALHPVVRSTNVTVNGCGPQA